MIPLHNLYEDEYTNYLHAIEEEQKARNQGDIARARHWREYAKKLERLAVGREEREKVR